MSSCAAVFSLSLGLSHPSHSSFLPWFSSSKLFSSPQFVSSKLLLFPWFVSSKLLLLRLHGFLPSGLILLMSSSCWGTLFLLCSAFPLTGRCITFWFSSQQQMMRRPPLLSSCPGEVDSSFLLAMAALLHPVSSWQSTL